MKNSLKSRWEDLSVDEKQKIESKFECCGFENPEDTVDAVCPGNYTQGCYDHLRNSIIDQTYLIAYIAIGAGLYQIFMLIFSFSLCLGSRKKDTGDVAIV